MPKPNIINPTKTALFPPSLSAINPNTIASRLDQKVLLNQPDPESIDDDEEDYGAFGSVNPRMLPNMKAWNQHTSKDENPKSDYDMNWDSEIPF